MYMRYASAAVTLDGAIYLIGGQGPSDTIMQRYDPTEDKWTAKAPLSRARDHVAAAALNGKLYALGGRTSGSIFATIEIYDPAPDMWTAGTSMQDTRSGFGAAVVNGKIYVAGGELIAQQPFSVRDTAEVLDPASNQWSYKAKLPGPLHGTGAVGYEGKAYVFGGASMAASASPRTGIVHILTP